MGRLRTRSSTEPPRPKPASTHASLGVLAAGSPRAVAVVRSYVAQQVRVAKEHSLRAQEQLGYPVLVRPYRGLGDALPQFRSSYGESLV